MYNGRFANFACKFVFYTVLPIFLLMFADGSKPRQGQLELKAFCV